ncbi:hypothetical protein N658DRAFT_111837 [Parathielavia hyrcaniae]|uniref:Uncharacterized protein n=1 Tax=Parathielavia hyrcaniae TaxID=113614 RepID=A0AAN6T5Y5_9PEZI|nr:hypothetical protein N658DRAFT_111837 [Parathielavia hyrcaniae]
MQAAGSRLESRYPFPCTQGSPSLAGKEASRHQTSDPRQPFTLAALAKRGFSSSAEGRQMGVNKRKLVWKHPTQARAWPASLPSGNPSAPLIDCDPGGGSEAVADHGLVLHWLFDLRLKVIIGSPRVVETHIGQASFDASTRLALNVPFACHPWLE